MRILDWLIALLGRGPSPPTIDLVVKAEPGDLAPAVAVAGEHFPGCRGYHDVCGMCGMRACVIPVNGKPGMFACTQCFRQYRREG